MKTYNVVIVGCGASGSLSALFCKEKSLAIIDSSLKPAKKILVTGNGRCNLTNKNMNSSYFNQNIDKFLNKFSVYETLNVFENLGLETYFDEEGRCYPISNSAKSVVDVLSRVLEQKADMYLGETVENIVVENNQLKQGFVIYTNKDCYYCKKLVVACGGNGLLNCIKDIGVEVKQCYPSLVSLNASKIKDLAGLKVSEISNKVNTLKIGDALGYYYDETDQKFYQDSVKTPITGILSAFIDLTIQDLDEPTLKGKVNTLTIADVFDNTSSGMLSLIPSTTKLGDITSVMNERMKTVTLGEFIDNEVIELSDDASEQYNEIKDKPITDGDGATVKVSELKVVYVMELTIANLYNLLIGATL